MPEKRTLQRAKKDKAEGKAPSTQAGEFVKEEIDHIREGKQGARSPQQAIAIGLSKARRAGVELAPPRKGLTSEDTRQRASRDLKKGHRGKAVKPGANRSKAATEALRLEPLSSVSKAALSKHAKKAAGRSKG